MNYTQAKAEAFAARNACASSLARHGWPGKGDFLQCIDLPEALAKEARHLTVFSDTQGGHRLSQAVERLNLAIVTWFAAADEIAEKATRATST